MVLPPVLDKLRDYFPADIALMTRSFAMANCQVEEEVFRVYRQSFKR